MQNKNFYLLCIVMCLQYVRLGNKIMVSLNNITVMYTRYCYSYFRPVETSTERLGNYTNVTQLVNDEVKTQTPIFFTLRCTLFMPGNTVKPWHWLCLQQAGKVIQLLQLGLSPSCFSNFFLTSFITQGDKLMPMCIYFICGMATMFYFKWDYCFKFDYWFSLKAKKTIRPDFFSREHVFGGLQRRCCT